MGAVTANPTRVTGGYGLKLIVVDKFFEGPDEIRAVVYLVVSILVLVDDSLEEYGARMTKNSRSAPSNKEIGRLHDYCSNLNRDP